MRVLILSCNTGEGHNSAAKALQEYFVLRGVTCDIKDALVFISKAASQIISKGHVFAYKKVPLLFGVGYRFVKNHPAKDGEESLMYEAITLGSEKLYAEICRYEYDVIISVHMFAALMMTKIRKEYNPAVQIYYIATDYGRVPGMEECLVDAAFIPHELLVDAFLETGIPRDKLIPAGIPVKLAFYDRIKKERVKKYLGVPEEKRLVLIMGGSMGAGPIKQVVRELVEQVPEDVMLAVICGNNRRLKNSLDKVEHNSNLRVIGYSRQVNLFMDAAELLVTKPGGLSSTEAVTKRLPLIFINAVPGCETDNLNFFTQYNMALAAEDAEQLVEIILRCLQTPQMLESIRLQQEKLFTHCTVAEIYEYVKRARQERG